MAVYFFLPRFAAMGHAFEIISNLKISFVALSFGAQLLSYLGSGYLLRTVVKLAAKPVSILDGALMTAGANSVGTLGGGVLVAGFALVFLVLGAALTALILCLRYREKLAPIATAVAGFLARLLHKPSPHAKIEAAVGHLLDGWDALLRGGMAWAIGWRNSKCEL
jgi:uncharacterized membrane protein YbhN (UPF0104 family)